MDIGERAVLEEAVASGMSTDKADMVFASIPYRIMHVFQTRCMTRCASGTRSSTTGSRRRLRPRLGRRWLRPVHEIPAPGLRVLHRHGSADLVANGDVALARGQVDHLTEDAVVLEDGTTLPADLVV